MKRKFLLKTALAALVSSAASADPLCVNSKGALETRPKCNKGWKPATLLLLQGNKGSPGVPGDTGPQGAKGDTGTREQSALKVLLVLRGRRVLPAHRAPWELRALKALKETRVVHKDPRVH